MDYPYNIKNAEMDKQDMSLIQYEIEKTSRELKRRSDVKNILLLHFVTTCNIEHELNHMPAQERKLCIKEIRGTLMQRIPDLFIQEEVEQNEKDPE